MPSGITTSRPAARRPRAEDLLDLVGHELRAGVQRRAAVRPRAGSTGSNARTSGVHSSGIADERAVVDADERREPARRREVVRRVHDLRRTQPPVDARRVGAYPRCAAGRAPGSGRTACRRGTSSRCRRARVLSVYGTRSGPASSARSAATISATAAPMPERAAEERCDVDRYGRTRRRRHRRLLPHIARYAVPSKAG